MIHNKSKLLSQPVVAHKGVMDRRRALELLVVGGLGAAAYKRSAIREYLKSILTPTPDVAIVERNGDDLIAQFRGNKFRVYRDSLTSAAGLDGMLYELNSSYNPHLRIKGDRLENLHDLFAILNEKDTSKNLREIKSGEKIEIPYTTRPLENVIPNALYYFPVYGTQR